MNFEEELAENIKDFSAAELTDLLAFIRALKAGIVNSVDEWIELKKACAGGV